MLDAATGAPLPAVRVELLPEGRLTRTTAQGLWAFDEVAPGAHTIRVSAEGFESGTARIAVAADRLVLDVPLARRPHYVHESVTVTARRDNARAYDVPRSVTVVDAEELARRLPATTPDALAEAAGVFVQKTNQGSGSPIIRGLVGNQVLVLVDGIRLNNATFRYGPNQYLATLDPALIERIEVVRGSGSVLYGSDAIGGVINVVTRRPLDVGQPLAVRGRASVRAMTSGMEQSGRVELAVTGPRGGLLGGLSLRNFGDVRAGRGLGVEAPSAYGETAADLRVELPLPRRQRLTFAFQHHRQRDVPRYDQVSQRGFARYAFDPQVRQLGYVQYERVSPGAWTSRFRVRASLHRTREQREYQRRQSDILTVERDGVLARGLSLELRSDPSSAVSVVSGLDYYGDAVDSQRRDLRMTTNQATGRRGLYPDGATAVSLAVFTHATLTRPRWGADGGFRVSRFQVSAPDAQFGSAHIAPTTSTGSAGGWLSIVEGLRLFGSVAQAFRAPNIDDLSSLGPFDFGVEVPAPHLQPETAVTVDGGVKLRTRAAGASLSLYRTVLAQLIDRVPGDLDGSSFVGDQAVYRKANVGSALIRGVEADADVALTSALTMSGSLTYTHGQVTSRGEPLRRIPPLNGVVALRLAPAPTLWLQGTVRFATRQDRLAAGDLADHRIQAGGTPGWIVLNAYAGHRVNRRFEIVVGVQNLFDEPYRTHGSGIDGPGRSAWLGLHARLR